MKKFTFGDGDEKIRENNWILIWICIVEDWAERGKFSKTRVYPLEMKTRTETHPEEYGGTNVFGLYEHCFGTVLHPLEAKSLTLKHYNRPQGMKKSSKDHH